MLFHHFWLSMFWKTNPVQADSFPFSPEIFLFFLEIQEFLPGYSLSGCFINPALVNVLTLSTQVFFSTEEFIIIASPLPGSCIFLEILIPMQKVLPLPGSAGCLWCSWLHHSDLCLCLHMAASPVGLCPNFPFPITTAIIVSALTLTQHDLPTRTPSLYQRSH